MKVNGFRLIWIILVMPGLSLSRRWMFEMNPIRKRTEVMISPINNQRVKEGETLRMTCSVKEHLKAPDEFQWFLNSTKNILHVSRFNMLTIDSTIGLKSSTSNLNIFKASPHDTGEYKCKPLGLYEDDVTVIKDTIFISVQASDLFGNSPSSRNNHSLLIYSSLVVLLFNVGLNG